MKYLLIILAFCISSAVSVVSAQLRIDLTLSPHPSTRLSDWQSRRETAMLMITSDKSTDVKIDARLSLNGNLIAQTKLPQMPVLSIPANTPMIYYAGDLFPDNLVTTYGELKQTSMRSGILPEGNYELCITLVSVQNFQPLSQSTCRSFTLQKSILPTLLQPEDNKKIVSGTEKTTLFVWSPMLPIMSTPVTYRIRVVEVLEGQSSQQAFVTNSPLFEKTVTGVTQMLWPQEIPLPSTGVRLVWAVQPEDEMGNPLILPERFTNTFTIIVLPTQDECKKILVKIMKIRTDGLTIEEEYWAADNRFQRISHLLEEAEERGDAMEIEKWKKDLKVADVKLEKEKISFDAIRNKYDSAITEYEECGK